MRVPKVVLASAASVVLLLGVTMPAAEAYEIIASDSTADRSRTFVDDEAGDIFSISFETSKPNQPHRIHGKIVATVPATIDDDIMLASTTIRCWGPNDEKPTSPRDYDHVLNQQRNVLRGETSTLSLRWTYVAKDPGTQRCVLYFDTVRPRPTDGADPNNQKIVVDNGSYIRATDVLHPAQEQSRIPEFDDTVVLSPSSPTTNVLDRTWRAPAGVENFAVNADLMMTSCTSTVDQCADDEIDRDGGTVNTRLVVGQLASDGNGYCAVHELPTANGADHFISGDRHHQTIRNGDAITVRTDPDCGREFRVYLALEWKSGAGIKLHDYSGVSAIIPNG